MSVPEKKKPASSKVEGLLAGQLMIAGESRSFGANKGPGPLTGNGSVADQK
jgi:hypothetical protein